MPARVPRRDAAPAAPAEGRKIRCRTWGGRPGCEVVDELHKAADSRIESQALHISRDCLNGLVQHTELFGRGICAGILSRADPGVEPDLVGGFIRDHAPGTVEKPVDPFHPLHAPRLGGFKRAHEHLIETDGIRPVLLQRHVYRNDIATRLGHFFDFARELLPRFGMDCFALTELDACVRHDPAVPGAVGN